MKKFIAAAASILFLSLSLHASFAQCGPGVVGATSTFKALEHAAPDLTMSGGEVRYRLSGLSVGTDPVNRIAPYLNEEDYEETPARRFEIIFFISMPVTLGLSFAGLAAYKLAAGTWGSFETIDYSYLVLSTVSLSFSVAWHDHRVVYKKRGT